MVKDDVILMRLTVMMHESIVIKMALATYTDIGVWADLGALLYPLSCCFSVALYSKHTHLVYHITEKIHVSGVKGNIIHLQQTL